MRRQAWRKALLIISFLLFPLTIYYLSPVTIIMGAREGIVAGSLVVFILLFLSSLVFARGFCGWLCPAGGLQDCLSLVSQKKARGGRYDNIKYLIWVPWLGVIAVMAVMAGGLRQVDVFLYLQYGMSVTHPLDYIPYYFFVGLISLLAITSGRRAFCHYICWMAPFMVIGGRIRSIFGWPSLGLRVDEDSCTECRACDRGCPMSLQVSSMVGGGSMHHPECILCGECADGCPKGCIRFSFLLGGRKA